MNLPAISNLIVTFDAHRRPLSFDTEADRFAIAALLSDLKKAMPEIRAFILAMSVDKPEPFTVDMSEMPCSATPIVATPIVTVSGQPLPPATIPEGTPVALGNVVTTAGHALSTARKAAARPGKRGA